MRKMGPYVVTFVFHKIKVHMLLTHPCYYLLIPHSFHFDGHHLTNTLVNFDHTVNLPYKPKAGEETD